MRGLILSAGLGERLRPLTLRKAKPAIEFLNIPMLGYPYYWFDSLGVNQIVLNIHYLPETIRHAAMHVIDPAVHLHFSHETAILGSGGGIWNARPLLEGDRDFVVANGDGVVLSERPDILAQMLAFHERQDSLCTLLVCPLEGVGTRLPGVWMKPSGEVTGFGKTGTPGSECFHYASYMILSRRIWVHLPEGSSNILYDVVQPQLANGERAFGFRADDIRWFETGNIPEYLAATKECLSLMRGPTALGRCARNILARLSPASKLSGAHLIADSARIEEGVRLEGFQVIGENCVIGRHTQLTDCVLLPDTHVNPESILAQQVR